MKSWSASVTEFCQRAKMATRPKIKRARPVNEATEAVSNGEHNIPHKAAKASVRSLQGISEPRRTTSMKCQCYRPSKGLTTAEAEELLAKYGRNGSRRRKRPVG
ncbi:hypothetical protein TcBrA4_0083230 [Trypanosoma cruzi]|nr:hypothetical protein TcBrA4_0083230 [Trypanosoma cruzi]